MTARIIDLTIFLHRNAFRRPPLMDARVIEMPRRHFTSVARIEKAQRDAKQSAEQINAERMLLCAALGLDTDAQAWDIAQALAEARSRIDLDQEVRRLRRKLDRIHTLANHMEIN